MVINRSAPIGGGGGGGGGGWWWNGEAERPRHLNRQRVLGYYSTAAVNPRTCERGLGLDDADIPFSPTAAFFYLEKGWWRWGGGDGVSPSAHRLKEWALRRGEGGRGGDSTLCVVTPLFFLTSWTRRGPFVRLVCSDLNLTVVRVLRALRCYYSKRNPPAFFYF
jgi:hypothetical protein